MCTDAAASRWTAALAAAASRWAAALAATTNTPRPKNASKQDLFFRTGQMRKSSSVVRRPCPLPLPSAKFLVTRVRRRARQRWRPPSHFRRRAEQVAD